MGAFGSQIMGNAGNFASRLTFVLFRPFSGTSAFRIPSKGPGMTLTAHGSARDGLHVPFR